MAASGMTVTGLDIGSSQVTAIIAEWEDESFKVVGVGHQTASAGA